MKKKKITIVFLALTLSLQISAQEDTLKPKVENNEATGSVIKKNEFSPYVFFGTIAENPAINNLKLDLGDEKFSMQGVIFDSKKTGIISTVKIEGKNENNTVNLFSGTKVNAKFSGTLLFSIPIKSWLSYTKYNPGVELYTQQESNFESLDSQVTSIRKGNNSLSEDSLKYHLMLKNPMDYSLKRSNYTFLSVGAKFEGAKYNLIDSTGNVENMVSKKAYSGWEVFLQGYMINYNFKKIRSTVQSFRVGYGEVNNIDDLDEYTISNSSSFTSGANKNVFDRKITGYFDEYKLQHRGTISYELNFYSMDTTTTKIGYLLGADFVYNSREPNYMRFNAGLNFPLLIDRHKKTSRIFISAIVSTTDPFNWGRDEDFSFKDSFSVMLRVATPLKLKFREG